MAILLSIMLLGCTDKNADAPFVLDLVALPLETTIGDTYFYPKPFSVRAKYSDNTEKNISSRVIWRSENSALIRVNKKGEIEKTGECEQIKCVVSLIATDPESGKSLRFTVNISQKKTPDTRAKTKGKTGIAPVQDKLDENDELQEGGDIDVDVNEANIEHEDETKTIGLTLGGLSSLFVAGGGGDEMTQGVYQNDSLETDVYIESIFFESQRVSLISGEEYFPRVMSLNHEGEQRLLRGGYECYSPDRLNASVAIVSPCQLLAARPGEIEIGVRLIDESLAVENAQMLIVDVAPKKVLSTRDGLNYSLDMGNDNLQQWLAISGLETMDYYRVQLRGNLSYGQRLSVYANFGYKFQDCMNTALLSFTSIACYFQAHSQTILLAIDNPDRKVLNAALMISRVDPRLFHNTEKQNAKMPVEITLNAPVSDFILANETGLNSRHFYQYSPSLRENTSLLVTLSNYDADIQLIVTGGGACRNVNEAQLASLKSCRILDYDGSKVLITVNGNSGDFNRLNKSTAEQGGTFYQLRLEKRE